MARKLISVIPCGSQTKRMPGNILVDSRHLDLITPTKLYSAAELAEIFTCSEQTILSICNRSADKSKSIDGRWIKGLSEDKFYKVNHVARILGCSSKLVYKLRSRGDLDHLKNRIPGWSLVDYIKKKASPAPTPSRLDNIRISTIIRIPGWSVLDYIVRHCSYL